MKRAGWGSSNAVSVCTLVRGRDRHLRNFLLALDRQSAAEFEVVVAYMQPQRVDTSGIRATVRQVHVAGRELRLAAARNAAAAAARGDVLIFLDVDCIASPSLVATYRNGVVETARCMMGEVRYLPRMDCEGLPPASVLDAVGVAHPARPDPPSRGWKVEQDPGCLWGLSFALPRRAYLAAGGMDERYVGYGGEETDFAQRLARQGTEFGWVSDARAYHQQHPVCRPPLDKFADIVRNAELYRRTWGRWCMEYWLEQFSRLGLIRFDAGAESLTILREPSRAEIAASFREDACYG